ncbi:hypothetical protein RIF29_42416 [Crotalaria pallida]|uniref:TFIIS N-terminal domain-containing protein n=1 Tax=Crotalaria pallida TaxID=3830 RepID=A0AAN9HTM0_CROPI
MDLDDFRSILEGASVDVWELMDAAIAVASIDDADELKRRRDGIVERLYTATSAHPPCPNCEGENNGGIEKVEEEEEEELDPYGGLFDDEQKKILEIKQQLEYPNQSEESLMELLQNLDDMDITFQALEDTDIGRHVNQLRKHSSSDVRRLVKLLVSKWKGIVDEWVKLKTPGQAVTDVMADEDSPDQKTPQNEHHQSPDFATRSPNPHHGNSGSGVELKPKAIPRKEAPRKPTPTPPPSNPTPQKRQREQRDSNFDAEKLASARKRLQENYKEAANGNEGIKLTFLISTSEASA